MNKEAKCDICSTAVHEPDGYLLTTTQIVRSPHFWRDYYERCQEEFAGMGISSYDAFLRSSARADAGERVARDATPWLVCEQCLALFEVAQEQAWVYARHWWESGGAFTPPDTGPAPLSEIKMEERDEPIPAPAPEEKRKRRGIQLPAWARRKEARPPRGVPRWPPVVALLNLTGLGLGYLYLKRWLRWLVHFLLTLGLIATPHLTNGASRPALWMIVFGVWLLWMTFDGWRQARRLVRAAPTGTIGRAWLSLALAVVIFVVAAGGLWGYAALGRREFAAGMGAYEEADCRAAMQHFNTVTTLYELTLSPNVAAADAGIVECSLLVHAANTRQQEEYAGAVSGYETYLHLYPESALLAFARDTLAATYSDWATQLRQAADYRTAIEKYQVVMSDYPTTDTGEQAATLAAETYAEWAAQLQEAGEYAEAIAQYQVVLNEYPDTPAGGEAAALAAEIYAEWAVQLREGGEYEEAIAKYHAILSQYPDAPAAGEAGAATAETYAEWAAQLGENGDYEEAVEKYHVILNEYPDAPAAAGVEETVAQTYAEWATQLREMGLYLLAIGKYKTILDDYPGTAPANTAQVEIAQTYNEWGAQLASQREYTEAMEKFSLAQEASDDPDVIAAAEAGYDEALWGLSQDTTSAGRQVMEQALSQVCDGDSATSPAIGLAEDEPGKALLCGSAGFSLPADLEATKPGHFRYAVSVDKSSTTVQRCKYSSLGCSGWWCPTVGTVVRKKHWWRVSVRDTLTGRVVGERSFYGSQPSACPSTTSFAFQGQESSQFGGSPSTDQVINWLQGVVR